MLGIVVTGLKDGSLGKRRENLIENTVQACIDHLKLNRYRGIIHVKQSKTIKPMDGWAVGYCTMDKIDSNQGKLWWGIIELTNQYPKELVMTLCHEMVHIKQYLKKELGMDGVSWMGEDMSDINYHDQPSEVEAYDMQQELFDICVDLKLV